MVCKPETMKLPLHLEEMIESVSNVQIIVDKARRPAQSATDEYYQSMSLRMHTRRERHTSYTASPIPRRQKLRVGAKSPVSSPTSRQRPSLRSSLQQHFPAANQKKICRWDNSSYDGDTSQEAESPAARPKMPVRSWSNKKNNSPSVPVRRGSLDNSLGKMIDDIEFVYHSDDDEDSVTSSTATISSLSPGIPLTTKDRPPVARPRLPDGGALEAQHHFMDQSTSALIRQVIDDLKLYDDSESNVDGDYDENE